jgi:hypothetical protein
MNNTRYKTTNWTQYNKALINRGSLTFWIDEEAIDQWHCNEHHGGRGRGYTYNELSITTALMVKKIFHLPLRGLQGFLDSIFGMMKLDLKSPSYSCISKRAKELDVSIKFPEAGTIKHLAIDSTGLKVFGEGEWKVKKHGPDKRRTWRKLHLAVDTNSHTIIAAELSMNSVSDGEVLPDLLKQTRRNIETVCADGAYDTRACYEAIYRKADNALIPPRQGAAFWDNWHPRNNSVMSQRLHGSNQHWKDKTGYHQRSLSETAMHRFKLLFGGKLSFRHLNSQVTEVMVAIRALNKLSRIGMPKTVSVD